MNTLTSKEFVLGLLVGAGAGYLFTHMKAKRAAA